MNKIIILTAPSGAGKTTLVRHLLKQFPDELAFSVSACTRPNRDYEIEGIHYYFLNPVDFFSKIDQGAFVEWEEVYPGKFYGTLKSEVERLWKDGKIVLFDIDVKGAVKIKSMYPKETLAIFVSPPSMEKLVERLTERNTESEKSLEERIAKAKEEMAYKDRFDLVLVNDQLDEAKKKVKEIVSNFFETQN